MKTNKLDSFESFVNSSLSGEEVAYNPSDWNDLSNRLNNIAPKPFYKNNWFLGGAAAIIIGVSSFAYYDTILEVNKTIVSELKQESTPAQSIEKIVNTSQIIVIPTVEEEVEEKIEDYTNTTNSISSETIGKEEIGNEPTTNHSKLQSSLPLSSPTVFDKKKKEEKEDVTIDLPESNYSVNSVLSGCKGLEVELSAKQQKNVSYLWSFGDGEFSNEINPTHQYNVSGAYKIELIVQSTIDERILTKSEQESNVVVFPDPDLELIINKKLDRGLTVVDYSYVGDELAKVSWSLGNDVSSEEKEVTTSYKKRGNYKVLLIATSFKGCKSITEENVFIKDDYNLLAPNAFTPNGDGLNDYFIPEALKSLDCNFTMVIRSRTEGVVFETTSLDRPWDGKSQKTNLNCIQDNYIWIVSLTNNKGQKEQYMGTILIKN